MSLSSRELIIALSFVLISLEKSVSATICSSSLQCGENEVCFRGRCKCEMGFFGLPNGFGVICNHHYCGEENDKECSAAFDYSSCGFVDGQPRCICMEDTVWNPAVERCQIKPKTKLCSKVGRRCSSPVGSFCTEERYCRCRLGFEPKVVPTFKDTLFKVICMPKSCFNDWQCWPLYGEGSKCGPAGTCTFVWWSLKINSWCQCWRWKWSVEDSAQITLFIVCKCDFLFAFVQ